MQVQVIKILSDQLKAPLVEFQSPYGIGRAIWAESVPELFQDYDMEYEIPETLVWGQTIVQMDEETTAVTYEENTLLLYGQLEHADEDGLGIVRLGESIIFVEIEALEKRFPTQQFCSTLLKTSGLIYDANLKPNTSACRYSAPVFRFGQNSYSYFAWCWSSRHMGSFPALLLLL